MIPPLLSRDIPVEGGSELAAESEGAAPDADRRWTRAAAVALGGTLLILGFRRRSILGAIMAVAGGWLLYRSLGETGGGASATLADRLGGDRGVPEEAMAVERSVTVGKPADELYELWRDPEQLARIVEPIGAVSAAETDSGGEATETANGDRDEFPDRLRWAVETPIGRAVSWEMDVVEDRPGERLRWESTEGAPVTVEMSVRFDEAPADRGTEVTFEIRADPPGGGLGTRAVSALDIVPKTVLTKALYRFKSLAETGEIPTLEKNPSARGTGDRV